MSDQQRIEKIIAILRKIGRQENLPEEFYRKLEGALACAKETDK